MIVIGKCSLCGGAVGVSETWFATVPQTPQCASCWATPKAFCGPTIDMQPSPRKERDVALGEWRERGGVV